MMSNEWSKQVEKTPELAHDAYTQALVPLIESALVGSRFIGLATIFKVLFHLQDIMKTGEDCAGLERKFKRYQSRATSRSNDFVSPIQHLRDMIPIIADDSKKELSGSDCDPTLILREDDPASWGRCITEARDIMPLYNRGLRDAIEADRAHCKPEHMVYVLSVLNSVRGFAGDEESARHDRDMYVSHADLLKQEYRQRYFAGWTHSFHGAKCGIELVFRWHRWQ